MRPRPPWGGGGGTWQSHPLVACSCGGLGAVLQPSILPTPPQSPAGNGINNLSRSQQIRTFGPDIGGELKHLTIPIKPIK